MSLNSRVIPLYVISTSEARRDLSPQELLHLIGEIYAARWLGRDVVSIWGGFHDGLARPRA